MSDELLGELTVSFSKILEISVEDMQEIVRSLVTVEELEEEEL